MIIDDESIDDEVTDSIPQRRTSKEGSLVFRIRTRSIQDAWDAAAHHVPAGLAYDHRQPQAAVWQKPKVLVPVRWQIVPAAAPRMHGGG